MVTPTLLLSRNSSRIRPKLWVFVSKCPKLGRPLYSLFTWEPGGEPRTGSSGPDEKHRASARIRGRRRKRVVNAKIAIHFKRDACKS